MNKHENSNSITRQLQVVFAISILILLISSYAAFYSNKKLIESSYWVNHTNEVIRNAEKLISIVKDAETGQRGYIITNDASFLQPYNGAYEKDLQVYQKLKTLTSDNPVQQQNLSKAKVLIDQRFEHLRHVLEQAQGNSTAERTTAFVASHEEMTQGRIIMDELRKVVDQINYEENSLLTQRTDIQSSYTRYTPVMVIAAALISILISILAYLRIKSDLDERLRKQKEDEQKYLETQERIANMERVTKKISEGDYSVRSADDAKDELGRISQALNDMVKALEANFGEMERRNWLQTGTMTLSDSVRGERFVKNVAGKIANSVASHIKAPIATVYIADGDRNLKLQGSYAASHAPEYIPAGSGLPGQAAINRELIVSDELPADYLRVASSVGSTKANYAIVVPLVFGDATIAILELGMLRKPNPTDIEYLRSNAETMAISLSAAINYERMQDLLEETQAQAEELQAQHNELENINAELEIQTEKLQASEEELKVQQEELQQANAELEERSRLLEERNQMISERNMEVQRKAEELAQSTRYKSEFMANMSHELRTPLNSILLLSRLLAENSDKTLSNEQVEYAKVIQSSGNGLLALIDEILDLSKIEAGKMQLEFGEVRINEINEDMRALFEPLANEKQVPLKIEVAEKLPGIIESDKMRLEQILKNLLSNAYKFTQTGSITLRVSPDKKTCGFINFSVIDTGIGIPKDKQQLIFGAFQQADGSTRRKYGGTGLGLSISKELAKLLGGDIYLQSAENEGSTFTISLPYRQADRDTDANAEQSVETETAQTATATPGTNGKSRYKEFLSQVIPEAIPDDRTEAINKDKKILIIEDDTNFAKSLLEFTRKKGYKGIVAVRGDEGLQLAKTHKPNGILLDIQLPVKSGWEVMEELKADPETKHIPVHIMSSHSVKKESLMKGAIDFINKPVAYEQMQTVFSKLEHVLNKKEKKVLIVEDNPKHAKALAYFLESFDINTEIKTDVEEGVEALKNASDCVILDMGIPDSHAYVTLEEIKKNPGLENLPIIVFTGKSLSMNDEQRIKQYADSIVVKTAHSYQRILDEVSLFLHLVEKNGGHAQKNDFRKLGVLKEVLKGKTVLVVDDDVRNIFSLGKALEKADMKVITAIDGKEAMEKLEANKDIDIVLLDMMMPQMDGYETASRIRKERKWKQLPVIAVTAKAMMGDREKCIQAGASDYITKPVDIDQLLSLLRVWLYDKI
ncbi:MAG: response regulator [Bacteroidetes bacterium]|nr:response regulator [Bacteroidota bacterium]